MKTAFDLYIETSNLSKEELVKFFGTKEVNVNHIYRDYNCFTRADKKEVSEIYTNWVLNGYCTVVDTAGLHHLNF